MLSPTPWPTFLIFPWSRGLSPLPGSCQTSPQSIRPVTPSSFQTTVQFPSCHYRQSSWRASFTINSCHFCSRTPFSPAIYLDSVLLDSTQKAVISATGDWHQHLDSKWNVAAVFFDLSKAFDTVPHQGLLNALSRIGISGSLHKWFTSYLSGRSQQVVLDGCSSSCVPVSSGVPQGSILGPLLFCIYMNPIASIPLSSTSRLLLYADDILL